METNRAAAIIEKFGGQKALADLLAKRQSTVHYWSKSGQIPAKQLVVIQKIAAERGIILEDLDDLKPGNLERAIVPEVSETDEVPGIDLSKLPKAEHRGVLVLIDSEIPCYVLDNGQRVIGRTSMTEMLTGIKGGGALEKYLGVSSLKPFIDINMVLERMVSFRLEEVEGLGRAVKGLPADSVIDICRQFMGALEATSRPGFEGEGMTPRQMQMAIRAGMFVAACAKVGLDALIDEVTGYQFVRADDALQVKLKAYLADEMRKWERTFPEELWKEFGRLTGWSHSVTKRPKYWGKLVMELIYEYLDPDVAKWLKEHAPKPRHGQNYHQWLTDQYGLRKLLERIWLTIGVAKTCKSLRELKERMAEMEGRVPVQFTLYLPEAK